MGWADELPSAPAPAATPQVLRAAQVTTDAAQAPAGWADELLRQIGLTARAGVTGVTALPALAGNAVNKLINYGSHGINAVAGTHIPDLGMPSDAIQHAETAIGLPAPANRRERIVQDIASSMAAPLPGMAIGSAMANGAAPVTQAIGRQLLATPGNQLIAGGAAGGSAGATREAGLGPGWQMAAGMAGGLAGAAGAGAAGSLARAVGKAVPVVGSPATEFIAPGAVPETNPEAAPGAVSAIAPNASPAATADLVDRTASLLEQNPGADPAAAARAADFRQLGIQPTLGQITRDPLQFASEQNIRSQSPPLVQRFNSQLQGLSGALGRLTGNPQQNYPAGKQLADALLRIDDGMRGQVTAAYNAARASSGADMDIPLQGFAQDYAQTLRDFPNNVPGGVQNRINDLGIMNGTQRKVFNMNDAEDLLKLINAHDGPMVDPATSAALEQLRNSVKTAIVGADDQGGPFAQARALAAQRFATHDAVPALDAVVSNRVTPDQIVPRFITGGRTMDTEGLQGLAELLQGHDPQAFQEMRAQLAGGLQDKAFGVNHSGDKMFSPEQYGRALENIGDARLNALFSPDEVDRLHAIGRVGSYIAQAPGVAPVNRSNTGATILDLATHIPMAGKGVQMLMNRAAIAKALEANLGDTQTPMFSGAGQMPVAPVVINSTATSNRP